MYQCRGCMGKRYGIDIRNGNIMEVGIEYKYS